MKALRLILISLLLAGCGIVPGLATATLTPAPTRTATPTSTPSHTPTPDVVKTRIAAFAATKTEEAATVNAIQTEGANQAAVILDEIKKASTPIEGLDFSGAKLAYGPANASLVHEVDNTVAVFAPYLSLKNFITSATFINPYETSKTGTWDYGILFRSGYGNDQYRLTILSNRSWSLVDANTWANIYSKNDKNILAKAGEENMIWLVVIDKKAYLFINGTYTQALDVGKILKAGDVLPATGLYAGNEKARKTTKFYDFFVWSLP